MATQTMSTWKAPYRRNAVFCILFLLAGFSYSFFRYDFANPNQTCRVALCLALLREHTVRIDPYQPLTIDFFYRDGHYYSAKAPGASLLALPIVAAGYYGLQARGIDDFTSFDPKEENEEPNEAFKFLVLLASLVVSFFSALGVGIFFLFATRLGTERKTALLCTILFAFGTPYAYWATLFFGHSLAAATLLIGFYLGFVLIQSGKEIRRTFLWWMLDGFILAYTFWIEYPAAISTCMVGFFFISLMIAKREGAGTILRTVALLFLGTVPVFLGFIIYNTFAHGAPLDMGYTQVTDKFEKMHEGFYGIKLPDLAVLCQTLFHPQNGILWYSPILILSPVFALWNIGRKDNRELNVLCLAMTLYYFLFNSSYAYSMTGGMPARHVTAVLPFMIIPFLSGWKSDVPVPRAIVNILFGLSVLFCVVAMSAQYTFAVEPPPFPSFLRLSNFLTGKIKCLPNFVGFGPIYAYGIPLVVWSCFGFLLWREFVVPPQTTKQA